MENEEKQTIKEIYKKDAKELLKEINDNSVDLVLTDPPYNISKKGQSIARNGGKYGVAKDIKLDFGEWDHTELNMFEYADGFVRVLKENGVLVLFYDKKYLGLIGLYLEEKYDAQIRHISSWVKSNPCPQARRVQWQNGVENFLIVTMNKGEGHHFNYELGQSPDYFKHSVNFKHLHPTQKPLDGDRQKPPSVQGGG